MTSDVEFTVPVGTELKYTSSCIFDEKSVEISTEQDIKESFSSEVTLEESKFNSRTVTEKRAGSGDPATVGGLAAGGAAIGAGIGVWFGGVGAVPGAVIGAGIGLVAGVAADFSIFSRETSTTNTEARTFEKNEQFQKSVQTSLKSSTKTFEAKAVCSEFEAAFSPYAKRDFDYIFETAVKDLPVPFNENNKVHVQKYTRFVEAYGTHVINRVILGGKRIITTQMSTSDYSELIAEEIDVAETLSYEVAQGLASSSVVNIAAVKKAASSGLDMIGKASGSAGGTIANAVDVVVQMLPDELASTSTNQESRESKEEFARNGKQAEAVRNIEATSYTSSEITIGGLAEADAISWSQTVRERPMPISYSLSPLIDFMVYEQAIAFNEALKVIYRDFLRPRSETSDDPYPLNMKMGVFRGDGESISDTAVAQSVSLKARTTSGFYSSYPRNQRSSHPTSIELLNYALFWRGKPDVPLPMFATLIHGDVASNSEEEKGGYELKKRSLYGDQEFGIIDYQNFFPFAACVDTSTQCVLAFTNFDQDDETEFEPASRSFTFLQVDNRVKDDYTVAGVVSADGLKIGDIHNSYSVKKIYDNFLGSRFLFDIESDNFAPCFIKKRTEVDFLAKKYLYLGNILEICERKNPDSQCCLDFGIGCGTTKDEATEKAAAYLTRERGIIDRAYEVCIENVEGPLRYNAKEDVPIVFLFPRVDDDNYPDTIRDISPYIIPQTSKSTSSFVFQAQTSFKQKGTGFAPVGMNFLALSPIDKKSNTKFGYIHGIGGADDADHRLYGIRSVTTEFKNTPTHLQNAFRLNYVQGAGLERCEEIYENRTLTDNNRTKEYFRNCLSSCPGADLDELKKIKDAGISVFDSLFTGALDSSGSCSVRGQVASAVENTAQRVARRFSRTPFARGLRFGRKLFNAGARSIVKTVTRETLPYCGCKCKTEDFKKKLATEREKQLNKCKSEAENVQPKTDSISEQVYSFPSLYYSYNGRSRSGKENKSISIRDGTMIDGGVRVRFDQPFETLPTVIVTPVLSDDSQCPVSEHAKLIKEEIELDSETLSSAEFQRLTGVHAILQCMVESITREECFVKCVCIYEEFVETELQLEGDSTDDGDSTKASDEVTQEVDKKKNLLADVIEITPIPFNILAVGQPTREMSSDEILRNVALGGIATQTAPGDASHVIDGKYDTNSTISDFWQVELGSTYEVEKVSIFYPSEMSTRDITVSLINSYGHIVSSRNLTTPAGFAIEDSGPISSLDVSYSTRIRVAMVKVEVTDGNTFSLMEVEVVGRESSTFPYNVAVGKSASFEQPNSDAFEVVDGNHSTSSSGGTVLNIDLGRDYTIFDLMFYSQVDNDFKVEVYYVTKQGKEVLVFEHEYTINTNQNIATISVGGRRGSLVKVTSQTALDFDEVQVMGNYISKQQNLLNEECSSSPDDGCSGGLSCARTTRDGGYQCCEESYICDDMYSRVCIFGQDYCKLQRSLGEECFFGNDNNCGGPLQCARSFESQDDPDRTDYQCCDEVITCESHNSTICDFGEKYCARPTKKRKGDTCYDSKDDQCEEGKNLKCGRTTKYGEYRCCEGAEVFESVIPHQRFINNKVYCSSYYQRRLHDLFPDRKSDGEDCQSDNECGFPHLLNQHNFLNFTQIQKSSCSRRFYNSTKDDTICCKGAKLCSFGVLQGEGETVRCDSGYYYC